MKAPVHNECLVREIESVEFARSSGRLADRAPVGAGDQDDGSPPEIAQRLKRLAKAILLHLQTGMWAEAGCPPVVVLQKAGPCLWQAKKPQRVAGRGRIENDIVEARHIAIQQSYELVEGGYLGGASAGKLLAYGRFLLSSNRGPELFEHAGSIALSCCLRVNVHREEPSRVRYRRRAIG